MASQKATTAVEDSSDSENHQPIDRPVRNLPPVQVRTSSPRFPPSPSTPTPNTPSHRRIAIAVDLSEESAYAVKWAVENYIRPRDAVILLHVRSTSVLYGADWGSSTPSASPTTSTTLSRQQMEEEFDNFTTTKANQLAQPLIDAHVPFKLHIVKDHDMEERLCLEIERLNLSAVIMGSRGIGAARRSGKGKLGSVSDYCVQHCVCPVVVVRYNNNNNNQEEEDEAAVKKAVEDEEEEEEEEEHDFHDAADDQDQHK